VKGAAQAALRNLTQVTRPIAPRSAGKSGSKTSLVRHVGRRSEKSYETPVVTVEHEDGLLIALPYGDRTDWLKNVLSSGKAQIFTDGQTFSVDRPEVVPLAEGTIYFRPKEQRLHRRFGVESALRVHRA
jgi:deazaflavin-dependent oxidoreductase (nitroreductase family)